MKKLYIFLLSSFICLFISCPIYSQTNRAGYDSFIPIDNSVNTMFPTEQIKINTIPGKNGGTGTESDPYIVATAEDLFEIAICVNNGTENSSTVFPNGNQGYTNQYFLVVNDLDLSEYDPWPCIGVPSIAIFYGNFDGGGHVISGLILDPDAGTNQGLFAVLGNNAIVHGITIKDSYLNGSFYTGGIVGAAGEFTTIYDCHNHSDANSSGYYTGGIAGAGWGTIYNCTNSGNHYGKDFCGGIVGDFYGTIYNCVNTGNMSGDSSIGGVVGYSDRMSAKNLVNAGKITGSAVYNGGVVGFVANYDTDKTTSYCLNFGDVDCSSTSSAAVIGRLWTEDGQPSHADHCYYDKQLTLKLGVAPGGDVPGVAEGKFTFEMTGDGLSGNLNNDFIYNPGLYPCPSGTETKETAQVAVAPASLLYVDNNNFDRYNSVNDHFTVAIDNDVKWHSHDEAIMQVFDNKIVLIELGTSSIQCTKGDAAKTIELTVKTAPPFIGVENNNNKIRVYPNPSTSYINIEGDNIQSISIIDNLGRILDRYHLNGTNINTINTENLNPNLYFIRIEMLDGTFNVEKFIKVMK